MVVVLPIAIGAQTILLIVAGMAWDPFVCVNGFEVFNMLSRSLLFHIR